MTTGPKSMNFIRSLNRGNFYLLSHSFISGMEVDKKCKISAQISKIMPARQKNTGTWGVNTTEAS